MNDKPIDPKVLIKLLAVYQRAWDEAQDFNSPKPGKVESGIQAVARAVLPDGFVAVPVAEIESGIQMLEESQDMTFDLWFRSLLPKEATDE